MAIEWISGLTHQCLKEPKVRYKVGDGEAPGEDSCRMEIPVKNYEKAGQEMAQLQYNGGMLDLE